MTAVLSSPTSRAPGGRPARSPRRGPRLVVAFALCLTALGYFLFQHYEFRWPLITSTPRSLLALAAYEFGYYRWAATLWRAETGLAYVPGDLGQLVHLAEREVAAHPEDLRIQLHLADLQLTRGDYTGAATTYESALQRDPESPDAAIGLATVRILQGAYPEARALFDPLFNRSVAERQLPTFLNFLGALDVLEAAPVTAERELTLAYAYRYLAIFDPGQYQTVIRKARRTLALDPTRDAAHFCAGVAYMKQEALDRAIQEFQAAVRINPGNAEAYRRLGFLYGRRGDPPQELASYRQAVAAAPAVPLYSYLLGLVLRDKYGDLKAAEQAFRQAQAQAPAVYEYQAHLADTLVKLRRYEEGLALRRALVEAYPAEAEAHGLLGVTLVDLHRYAEALPVLQRALELGPWEPYAVRNLAIAYQNLGRLQEAVAVTEEAVRQVPHDVETLRTLATLYRRVGRYQDAHRALQEVLVLRPNHPGALRELPYVEGNLGP